MDFHAFLIMFRSGKKLDIGQLQKTTVCNCREGSILLPPFETWSHWANNGTGNRQKEQSQGIRGGAEKGDNLPL